MESQVTEAANTCGTPHPAISNIEQLSATTNQEDSRHSRRKFPNFFQRANQISPLQPQRPHTATATLTERAATRLKAPERTSPSINAVTADPTHITTDDGDDERDYLRSHSQPTDPHEHYAEQFLVDHKKERESQKRTKKPKD